MDPVRNPFAPGAGSRPPELAGRDRIIADADVAIQRVLHQRAGRSMMLIGLRGVGKTVLLARMEELARGHGHITSMIEAPEDRSLTDLLYPKIHQAIRRLSRTEAARAAAHRAMGALRSFVGAFKINLGAVSIAVDPAKGVADSGDLETDLADLFVEVGTAAQAAGTGWSVLIDEVQYLGTDELAAIIVAIHQCNQRGLPVLFFGAGLPQVAALSGEAKSYAERLFSFADIGPLDAADAALAVRQPIEEEGEAITANALSALVAETHGYPYFLQEWGFQAWNVAAASPIDVADVNAATAAALARLDDGFFKVRYDRLTPKEREYVQTMAALGTGPYRSSDVADKLGETVQSLGPRRAKIISKGMIYSPAHGDIAFTVPLFEDYLQRQILPQL